jgi:ubiquinone/menaquinone biosynthesis C-methylase UbiE
MDDKSLISVNAYDAIAHKYDAVYGSRIYFEQDLKDFLSLVPKQAKILDAGCGSGHVTRYLGSMGFQPTGLDLSTRMLTIARQKAPQLDFVQADLRSMGLESESFDAVISLFAIIHVRAIS